MEECREDDSCAIIRSPFDHLAKEIVVPDVPFATFMLEAVRKNLRVLGDRAAAVDAVRNKSLLYKDIEPIALRFAGALTKMGFVKGDVLFYVTYNAALLYGLHFGVWLCGGAVRGCFQREEIGEMERQMRDAKARFVLCEPDTADLVKMAAGRLGWPVNFLSIDGAVEGASPVEGMVADDGDSAYNKDVIINPKEDTLFIPSTNGSTGLPKGVLHTHHNMVTFIASIGAPIDLEKENLDHETIFSVLGNFNIGPYIVFHHTLALGNTFVSMSNFEEDKFFKFIDQYKPDDLLLFPYLANVISRCPAVEGKDLSSTKRLLLGGSVVDQTTLEALSQHFRHAKFSVIYGMTEIILASANHLGFHYKIVNDPETEPLRRLKILEMGKEVHVSCGPLLPLVEAKIVDTDTGKALKRGDKGKVLVRSPCRMKGYLKPSSKEGYQSSVDEHGWIDTGDLGFFDDDGHLYIIDRLKLIFKYLMHQVSPADIERVILRHPSVHSVGVVGAPHPDTTSAARGYVVLKSGCHASEEEIMKHVAENTPFYKHLHGGVAIVDKLPQTIGGKLDRKALLSQAIIDMKSSSTIIA